MNAREVRNQMLMEGALFATTNDSEVMLNLIARESHMDLVEATAGAMQQLKGGYACVLMSRTALIGFRDPNGVRPLVIGQREGPDGAYVIASEPCALYTVGASAARRVARRTRVGRQGGLHSLMVHPPRRPPAPSSGFILPASDGELDGVDTYASRIRMGKQLARETRYRPMWWCRCPIPASARPSVTPVKAACPSSSAFPKTLRGPHLYCAHTGSP